MFSNYVDRFEAAVSTEIQAAIALAMLAGYREAAAWARTELRAFGWEEALGAIRWFLLQEKLLQLRDRYPVLRTNTMRNTSGSHVFGLVQVDDVYFTVSKVSRPDAKPPDAEFRRLLQSPVQLSWLDDWSVLPVDGVYALLIHGPCNDDPTQPGFIQIKFMDGNDGYLPQHIDLHKRYLAAPPAVPREEISKRRLVRARRLTEKQLS